MKRITAILMAGMLMLAALAALPANEASAEEMKQVFVIIKNRGDLSYWDSIAAGGDRAAVELAERAVVRVIETGEDLTANLTAMYEAADAGADVILTAADYRDNIVEIALEFPDIACVIISENIVDQAPNIYGFDFLVSEASFLAGVVAADRAAQDNTDTIGFIGGMDEAVVIQEFFVGYIQGAKYFNPDIRIVFNYVGGWRDPDTARVQAEAQFNDARAAVIFAAAGGSGNGVHTAAANTGRFVIGVDTDQSLMYDQQPEIQERFITSVLKLTDNAVFYTIQRYLNDGSLPFGQMDILGVAEDSVGIVENHLFDEHVSAEGKARLEDARSDISSGVVSVWSAIGKTQAEIQAKIAELIQ